MDDYQLDLPLAGWLEGENESGEEREGATLNNQITGEQKIDLVVHKALSTLDVRFNSPFLHGIVIGHCAHYIDVKGAGFHSTKDSMILGF